VGRSGTGAGRVPVSRYTTAVAAGVQVPQPRDEPELQDQQDQHSDHHSDQQMPQAHDQTDHSGRKHSRGGRDPTHVIITAPEDESAADEANTGDDPGQCLRAALPGHCRRHGRPQPNQRERAVPRRGPAELPLKADGVGKGESRTPDMAVG